MVVLLVAAVLVLIRSGRTLWAYNFRLVLVVVIPPAGMLVELPPLPRRRVSAVMLYCPSPSGGVREANGSG